MQRDRRIPAAEPDTRAGEAITADLQQLGGELQEFTQIGGTDAVILCGRAGSGRRAQAQHLTRGQRLHDGLRGGRGRIGVCKPNKL